MNIIKTQQYYSNNMIINNTITISLLSKGLDIWIYDSYIRTLLTPCI